MGKHNLVWTTADEPANSHFDTIFGGQNVKLLRLITNSDNLESDILTFQFHQDEKVMLGIREFKSIHISIMDVTGSPVKSESNFPSRLQLMFSLD